VIVKKASPFRSVVIFGGAGFIGSNLAHHLLTETEAKVHIFDNLSRSGVKHNLTWLQQTAGNSGRLRITIGDVRNERMVEQAMRYATEVYHLAAQVAVTGSITDPVFDFDVNLRGTLNVLEAARKASNPPFILFTSTNKVYGDLGNPALFSDESRYRFSDRNGISESQPVDFHSPYGCSKGAADQYVRDYARIYGLKTVVFRMSCIAGQRQFGNEDQGWVAHFLYSALQKSPLTIYGDGKQVRDVLCVDDLLDAFEAVRSMPTAAGQIFNVGGGPQNTISLLELVRSIEQLTGSKVAYRFEAPRPGDQLIYVTDHRKLTALTGWAPKATVAETLRQIHQWWRKNRALFAREEELEAAAGSMLAQEAA
jgi:CDP-paratose 2-epimerase